MVNDGTRQCRRRAGVRRRACCWWRPARRLWCIAVGLALRGVAHPDSSGRIARPRPRRGMRFLLGAITALLVVAVALSFRTLNGLAAGTALLVVMGALKVLESRSRRDDAIVVGVALFLLLAAALAGQALWRMPLYLLPDLRRLRRPCAHRASGQRADARAPRCASSARALAMSIPLARRLLRLLSAHLRAILDAAAWQRGDHRPFGRDVAGQHRRARHRIRPGFSRPLRGSHRRGAPRSTGAARC